MPLEQPREANGTAFQMNRSIPSVVLASLAVVTAREDEGVGFFESKVLRLLQQRCYECHSHENKIKGGLALDLRAAWGTGGDNGPAKLRDVFDFTQPAQMSGKRAETAVPTQALFLINGDMLRSRATELAKRLTQDIADPGARIEALWLRVLNRPVAAAEREDALQFLESRPAAIKGNADLAPWIELCHALLASDEFLLRM